MDRDRRVGILLQEFAQEEVETKRAGDYEKTVKKLTGQWVKVPRLQLYL